jgi:hypothetical protein
MHSGLLQRLLYHRRMIKISNPKTYLRCHMYCNALNWRLLDVTNVSS